MFVVTVETEVWGDDRDPRVSVSHRAECERQADVQDAVQDLLKHMTPKYRLVIERKEDEGLVVAVKAEADRRRITRYCTQCDYVGPCETCPKCVKKTEVVES